MQRTPLVIVEGFFSAAGPALWGNIQQHSNHDLDIDNEQPPRRVIFASVGPVSSLHDRACELYYALKGGTVDYGASHAEENAHARYGRTHQRGLYAEWSKEKPLHFLGHSMGGPTIIKLQWLISTGFFSDVDHPDMLLSVTTISAPFRGSQAVYTLGERTNKAPSVRPFSVGSMLTKFVHIASYFAPVLPAALDFHADARGLSFKESSVWDLASNLWHSEWAESRDAMPFDVTFEASDRREACMEGSVNPGTFYRSYAACMTQRDSVEQSFHSPPAKTITYAPFLYILSRKMGTFDFSVVSPVPGCITSPEPTAEDVEQGTETIGTVLKQEHHDSLWANDGVVPLFSQWHPHACCATRCRHHAKTFTETGKSVSLLEPGIWHVYHVDDATHISLAPIWLGTSRQEALWKDVGRWLRAADNALKS